MGGTTHCERKRNLLFVFETVVQVFFETAVREHFFESAPGSLADFFRAWLLTNTTLDLVENAVVIRVVFGFGEEAQAIRSAPISRSIFFYERRRSADRLRSERWGDASSAAWRTDITAPGFARPRMCGCSP